MITSASLKYSQNSGEDKKPKQFSGDLQCVSIISRVLCEPLPELNIKDMAR